MDAVHEFEFNKLWLDGAFRERAEVTDPAGRWRLLFPSISLTTDTLGPKTQFPNAYFTSELTFPGYTESGSRYAVSQLAVIVKDELDLEGDFESRWRESRGSEVQQVLAQSAGKATDIVRRFIDWVRTDGGQPSVGRFESREIRMTGSHVFDETGKKLNYGSGSMLTVDFTPGPTLDPETAVRYLERSVLAEGPRLSATIYADARHDYDVRRKVLFAAVALEIEIKGLLQDQAGPDQIALIELLLNHPRDFSMSAASLFHRPCIAVLGHSLKDDDPRLFRLIEQLFESRNRIAHRALVGLADTAELAAQVTAAGEAMSWCQQASEPRTGR